MLQNNEEIKIYSEGGKRKERRELPGLRRGVRRGRGADK
jgi:hypothetical protein